VAAVCPLPQFSLLFDPKRSLGVHWDAAEDKYIGRQDAFYGCSVSHATVLMRKFGYSMLQLDGWDVSMFQSNLRALFSRCMPPPQATFILTAHASSLFSHALHSEEVLFNIGSAQPFSRYRPTSRRTQSTGEGGNGNSQGDRSTSPCLFKYNIIAQAHGDRFEAGNAIWRYMLEAGGGFPFALDYT
jgi:hypothetical protein